MQHGHTVTGLKSIQGHQACMLPLFALIQLFPSIALRSEFEVFYSTCSAPIVPGTFLMCLPQVQCLLMFQVATALAVGWGTHQLCWLVSPLYCHICKRVLASVNLQVRQAGSVKQHQQVLILKFVSASRFTKNKSQISADKLQRSTLHQ